MTWQSMDPTQLPSRERVSHALPGRMPASLSKMGLGASGSAPTTGSRLMRNLDPLGHMTRGDVGQSIAEAANAGVAELIGITRVGQVGDETSILELEGQSRNYLYGVTRDNQDSGVPGLPVIGSDPSTVNEAILMTHGDVYEQHRAPNPAQVRALVTPEGGNVPQEYLHALALADREREMLASLPSIQNYDRFEVNNASGLAYRLEMEEQARVPKELIAIALEAQNTQIANAPKPAAVVHPAASNYEDQTGTKILAGASGPGLAAVSPFRGSFGASRTATFVPPAAQVPSGATLRTTELIAARPDTADYIVGSGEGVNNTPEFVAGENQARGQNGLLLGLAAAASAALGLFLVLKK